MKFIVDAQLPPALARTLNQLGHEAEHVEDAGLRHAKDRPIWNHALARDQAIVSKDEDFANRTLVDPTGPAVIWLRIPNCSRRALLDWFVPQLPAIVSALGRGARLIELR